jgi:hypothetical protein
MLAKLLAFLLQSKAAAISAVLVVGTTGALVSASTQNGVTTITVTQSTSASPDSTTTLVVTDKSKDGDSDKDDEDKANTASCDTSALRDAVHAVNGAFSQDHTALMHLRRDHRGSAADQLVESTDKALKQIRQAAVKAIEATNTCAKQEDQDKDENDSDKDSDNDKDEHHTTTGAPTNTTTVTFTETDAKGIAADAISRMTTAFNDAKTKLAALPATPKAHDDSHRTTTEHPEDHD